MFRTELLSSNFRLVILCTDSCRDIDKNVKDNSNTKLGIPFDKIIEFLIMTAQATDEFINCLKNMTNFVNVGLIQERLRDIQSDLSIKIENVNCIEDASYMNRKEFSKPRLTKDVASGSDIYFIENMDPVFVSNIKQELEDKHNREMSELREYFQNKCSDLEKQYKEEVFNQRSCVISDPEDEAYERFYQNFNKRPKSADAILIKNSISDEDSSLNMIGEMCKICKNQNKYVRAELHRITKIYEEKLEDQRVLFEREKLDEACKMKREIEAEYNIKINKLRSDLNTMAHEKKFEQAVRNLHQEVKEEYNKELVNMKSKLYSDYCNEIKKNLEQNKAELNSQHCEEINRLKSEWDRILEQKCKQVKQLESQLNECKRKFNTLYYQYNDKVENVVADVITKSALKNVIVETEVQSQLAQRDEMLSVLSKQLKEMKLTYEEELNQLNLLLKTSINEKPSPIMSPYKDEEHHVQQLDSPREVSEHSSVPCTELFSELYSTQELEIADKITEEINKMKNCYKKEVSLLKQRNKALQNIISDFERSKQLISQNSNEHFMASLISKIQELLSTEDEEECQTLPADIATIEKLFSSRYEQISNTLINDYENKLDKLQIYYEKQLCCLKENMNIENNVYDKCTQTELLDLEKTFERDKLKSVNEKFQYVIKYFTEYLLNCEKELNHSLIDKLISCQNFERKITDKHPEYYNLVTNSEKEKNEADLSINHVHFTPDVSSFLHLINESDLIESNNETSLDVSILQLELNTYLEKIKNQAATILTLTASKNKNVACETRTCCNFQDVAVQTDLVETENEHYAHLKQQEEINVQLRNQICLMERENVELKERLVNLESIEAYGESLNSQLLLDNKFQLFPSIPEMSMTDPDCSVSSQDLCNNCDKVKEQTKHIIDDFRFQLEAADKKIRNLNKFLDEQTAEWDCEREKFDKKIQNLENHVREKEKKIYDLNEKIKQLESDLRLKNNEIINLEANLQELSLNTDDLKYKKQHLETEKILSRNKIVSLRDRIDELEKELADKSEFADKLQRKLDLKNNDYEKQSIQYQKLITELENKKDCDTEELQNLREQHQASYFILRQVKKELSSIECTIVKRTKELEVKCLSPFSDDVILTSPSEDVSTSEPLEEYSIASPSSTDTLLAVDVPKDFLPCLCTKLQKLYNAEEALLRHIQDQNLYMTKLSNQLEEAQFECDTFQEKLRQTTSKLSEVKIKLDEYQHKDSKIDSEAVSKLNEKLVDLQSSLDLKSSLVTQKESKITDLQQKIINLEDYIKTSEFEIMKIKSREDEVISNLQNKLEDLTKEKQQFVALISSYRHESDKNFDLPELFRMLIDEKNADLEYLEQKVSALQSEIVAQTNNSDDLNIDKINSDDNEQSDQLRCTIEADSLACIRNIMVEREAQFECDTFQEKLRQTTSKLSEVKIKLDEYQHKDSKIDSEAVSKLNEKLVDLQSSLDLKSSLVTQKESKITDLQQKIINLEDYIKTSEFEIMKIKSREDEVISNLQNKLEDLTKEKQQFVALISSYRHESDKNFNLPELFRMLIDEKNADLEYLEQKVSALQSEITDLQQKIINLEDYIKTSEFEIMKIKSREDEVISNLQNKLEDLTKEKQQFVALISSYRHESDKNFDLPELFRMLIDEKNADLEYLEQKVSALQSEIVAQTNNSDDLNIDKINSDDNEQSDQLRCTIEADSLACIRNIMVERPAAKITSFNNNNSNLNVDNVSDIPKVFNTCDATSSSMEEPVLSVVTNIIDTKDAATQVDESDDNKYNDEASRESLEYLTEKVQKEVDRAVTLDENILNNLDVRNNYDSVITISSMHDDIKSILLKALRTGFESLSSEDKIILQLLIGGNHEKEIKKQESELQIKHLKQLNSKLGKKLEYEKNQNEELTKNASEFSNEIKRLNMILRYLEDRSDFFTSKMQEYQNRATEAEINFTKENTRFLQLEMAYEAEKKRILNKQTEDAKQLDILEKRLTNVSNENIILKQQVQDFQYRIQILTAELNSARIMGKYNSDTESEISQAINPLKVKLENIEKKYGSIILQYEKEKNKVNEFKFKYDRVTENNLKLKMELEKLTSEKQALEFHTSKLKSEISEQKDLNDKLLTKIALAELNEKRIKKQIKTDMDAKEIKLRNLNDEYLDLQRKFQKLDTEYTSLKQQCFCSIYENRLKMVVSRMLKAESCRRALTWQKYFLLRRMPTYNECKLTPKQKFRSVGICIILINRVQILMQHRQKHNYNVLAVHWNKY